MNTVNLNAWVIDRDAIYQNYMSSVLETAGFNAQNFECGEECLYNIHQKPDVIVLDSQTGKEYGSTGFLRRIQERHPEITVIFTSSDEGLYIYQETARKDVVESYPGNDAGMDRIKMHLDMVKKSRKRKVTMKKIWSSQVIKNLMQLPI